jgi:2-polyprenyl-3-methyl-5-hydroxy-6-metoxy-1,4-benzoquinol methylase
VPQAIRIQIILVSGWDLVNIENMSKPASMIQATRACPISGSKDAYVVCSKDRHGKPLRNIVSASSGLIYVDPVPFENTEEFYKTEYRKSYKGVHKPKPKHVYRAGEVAMGRFSRLSNYLSDGAQCLDAGSSSGEFVYLLKTRGFAAQGVEANIPYAQYSQAELGIPVSISPFSEFQTDQKFDLITMFHVLEHLENPVRDLSYLGGFLKPGGKLVVEVPNILYPNMAFSHKWHPGHLFSFTEKTLSLLLEKAGFKTISCSPIEDGGNLWGVFERLGELGGISTMQSTNFTQIYYQLLKGKWSYRFNISNYFKFVPKILKQFAEKSSSRAKSGRDILDNLYLS